MERDGMISGSILLGTGIIAQILVEYFITVEAADFSMLTEALVWMTIIAGTALTGYNIWSSWKLDF